MIVLTIRGGGGCYDLAMRIALALVLFAGCIQASQPDPGSGINTGEGGWGTGPGGTGGAPSSWCQADADCGGGSYVCARDGECLPSTDVRTVHVTWTIRGAAANTTSCSNALHLDISFIVAGDQYADQFGFSPVPCIEGKFTIDKLPNRFDEVQLAKTGDLSGFGEGLFGSDGTVALDLSY